ncbi:MAG: cytochrome C551 [Deltaproteobacteria bacterium RIFOXYA12_FULL_58_15]|nr:MAG: cytochrome C551 [Deltaproteobacteria bacterium RIFOXYA12_FULL_58_15]OGR10575.1 MAG: cytochrome C551 [Deltaproteobacteria bacterium RIFOXYB12_FULL_58_9]
MIKPKISGRQPAVVELGPGTYHWCACGQSAGQPFCDGSHQGTDFEPLAFELAEKKRVALCLCKHTTKPPHCDGTHNSLE